MKTDHFIYRYFKPGTNPLKSISDLADDEIVFFMKEHFPNHKWFHANPEKRIKNRRKIENWLYEQFIVSGGEPKTKYPCYFTLGECPFLKERYGFDKPPAELKIPLNLFSNKNISFTYPDSFFSESLNQNKDHKLYNEELNGKVFTLDEVLNLLAQNKIPKNAEMETNFDYKYDFYIEAQVWDYGVLDDYNKIKI
jgi:hypothetical protein